MKSKKGIELSVNFLVMFILGIVVFGMGIYFVQVITSQAFDANQYTQDYLNAQIESISCSARDKVCITNNFQNLRRGDVEFVGLTIYNYGEDELDFTITPNFRRAYNLDDSVNNEFNENADYAPRLILVEDTISIQARTQQQVGLAISVPRDAPSGRYVWTVEIHSAIETIPERITFYVR